MSQGFKYFHDNNEKIKKELRQILDAFIEIKKAANQHGVDFGRGDGSYFLIVNRTRKKIISLQSFKELMDVMSRFPTINIEVIRKIPKYITLLFVFAHELGHSFQYNYSDSDDKFLSFNEPGEDFEHIYKKFLETPIYNPKGKLMGEYTKKDLWELYNTSYKEVSAWIMAEHYIPPFLTDIFREYASQMLQTYVNYFTDEAEGYTIGDDKKPITGVELFPELYEYFYIR